MLRKGWIEKRDDKKGKRRVGESVEHTEENRNGKRRKERQVWSKK